MTIRFWVPNKGYYITWASAPDINVAYAPGSYACRHFLRLWLDGDPEFWDHDVDHDEDLANDILEINLDDDETSLEVQAGRQG